MVVLPFVNLSADPEQEFFCDGVTEEIINALAQVRGLRVLARTSAFAFKGKRLDVREIGGKLDVQASAITRRRSLTGWWSSGRCPRKPGRITSSR